ncbi:MAG: hypothetical protein WCK77_21830 [Verrucomicrobiota bacterium]
MTLALINGTEIFYLAGHPDHSERVFSSAQDVRISGKVSVEARRRIRALAVEHVDRGQLATQVSFSTSRGFASNAAAEAYAALLEDAAELSGILVIRADGGDSADTYVYMCRAVVSPPAREVSGCSVRLHYSVVGGAITPEGKTGPDPIPELPKTYVRISEINGAHGWEKWFDFGFDSPELLTGSASAGWSASDRTFSPLWREDLTTWITGKFTDVAGGPDDNGDGTWRYWCRSLWPVDSAIKTGTVSATSYGDYHNNPLTALTIKGVVQSLPHFPYTMPGDAAQMQTDIRAAGWTGATVVSSSGSDWEITLPSITFGSYLLDSQVFFPVWYHYDIFGNLIASSVSDFAGSFVNSAGVRTAIIRQFGRLFVSSL